MLTIAGPSSRYCDGISRRSWLRIGGLALGGLSLPEILRAEARSGLRKPAKGIIMVLLPGGRRHLDMYDLKPEAPTEIRGEFRPIATNVPGIEICELMPRLAGMTDKLTLIRSLVGFRDDHNTHWCSTGWESHPQMHVFAAGAGLSAGRLAFAGRGAFQAVRLANARRSAVGRSDADRSRLRGSSSARRRASPVISARRTPASRLRPSTAATSSSTA